MCVDRTESVRQLCSVACERSSAVARRWSKWNLVMDLTIARLLLESKPSHEHGKI